MSAPTARPPALRELLGRRFQILTLLAGVAWYLVGWWVLATFMMSRIRERRHARAEDA